MLSLVWSKEETEVISRAAQPIPGGYILLARKIGDSDLMDKPPHYLKLWIWMLTKANWRDGEKLKRGQLMTSIAEMQDAGGYRVGYRQQKLTRDEVRSAYEAFTKARMITTAKTTRGLIVTICNYGHYQDPKNYEAHNESHNVRTTKPRATPYDTEKREKKNISCSFEQFWNVYPKKKARRIAEKAFTQINPDDNLLAEMLKALEWQKQQPEWLKDNGQYIPLPASWLKGRRWEDEPSSPNRQMSSSVFMTKEQVEAVL